MSSAANPFTPATRSALRKSAAGPASGRNFWAWAMSGALLGLFLALLLFAPARWLAAAIEHFSQGRVVLTEARGSVWSGSARVILTGGRGTQDAVIFPDRLQWVAKPNGLGLSISALFACCSSQATAIDWQSGLREQRITINSAQLLLPAHTLTGLGAPFNTLDFKGDIKISANKFILSLRNQQLSSTGTAEMQFINISSRMSTLPVLGTYRITVNGGEQTSVQLETLSGALLLNGQGQWSEGRLRFSGQARAAAEAQNALDNVLNIIGIRNGEYTDIRL